MDKFIKYSFKFRYPNDLDFSVIKTDSTEEADCNVDGYIKILKEIITFAIHKSLEILSFTLSSHPTCFNSSPSTIVWGKS